MDKEEKKEREGINTKEMRREERIEMEESSRKATETDTVGKYRGTSARETHERETPNGR